MADKKNGCFDCLGVKVSAINMLDACETVQKAITQDNKIYVCVCPVSTVIECVRNNEVLSSVNSADMATPDGMPVVWWGKLLGYKNTGRVYGPDLLLKICALSQEKGYKNYFYGSSPEVIDKLKVELKRSFPELVISGAYSPPFRELSKEEDELNIQLINSSNSDILWVGLGSPKQDLWMNRHRGKLKVPVMIGVGAAFDFASKTKKQAPRWMRNSGLEWLFRLITEPKRLWKRYLFGNSLFLLLICRELFSGNYFKNRASQFKKEQA